MPVQTLTPLSVVNLPNGISDSKDWQNLDNAKSDNSLYAFSTFDSAPTVTKYLYSSEYNFNIPSDSTIQGITARVQKRATGSGTVKDHFVGLLYPDGTGFSITFPGEQEGANWTGTESTSNYGGSNVIWNKPWTSDEINSNDFGIVISAMGQINDTALIDVCKITVHYNNVVSEIGTGGGEISGGSLSPAVMNEIASGGVTASRLSTHDLDEVSGGAVMGGTSVVTIGNNATATDNQVNFTCTGDQVVPPHSTDLIVHASIAFDPSTNVIRWYINNTIPGINAVRIRGPAPEGQDGGITVVRIDSLQDVSINPIIGQAVITSEQMGHLQNGLLHLFMRQDFPQIIVRGQIVQRASVGASGSASFTYNETSEGGINASGNGAFTFNEEAAGGAESSGNAIGVKLLDLIAEGGIVTSGHHIRQKFTVLDGIGGIEATGVSETQATYTLESLGGAEVNGKIIQGIHQYIPSAGIECGGEGSPFIINEIIPSGGVKIDGSININMFWLSNPVEDGGLEAGGNSRKERIRILQKAVISGIGNSLFSDNILKIKPTKERLILSNFDETPNSNQEFRFEKQPTWCFVDKNDYGNCCALVGDSTSDDCDGSIPKIIKVRQRHHLPPKNRDQAKDR